MRVDIALMCFGLMAIVGSIGFAKEQGGQLRHDIPVTLSLVLYESEAD